MSVSVYRRKKIRLRARRGLSASSMAWLNRQLNDPYVSEAKREGYRSRAAFKLLQLDERFHLLRPGLRVVDLGAAPGGWSQIAAIKVKAAEGQGMVVAIDILNILPLPGVLVLQGDFLDPTMSDQLIRVIDGKADIVLSDMAAPSTGHPRTDHLRIILLCEHAFDFAARVLTQGGSFVAKLFHGGITQTLLKQLKQNFAEVRHVKPPASRNSSAEVYLVATGFRKSV